MQKVVSSCEHCIQHKGSCAKAPMWPIIVTTPLELLHVDFTSIETMMELDQLPNMVSLFVFWPHYETHYGVPDPRSNCKNCSYIVCSKDTSWPLEHQPSSWVTKGPTLKVTSSENFWRSWFSLEQNCWFIENKLSSTAVDFIRSEGIAERQHLIWGKASSLSMPRT